jgi:hypothetical protein
VKGLLLAVVFSAAADHTSVPVGDRVTVTYSARIPAGSSLTLDALVTPAPAEGSRPAGGTVLDFENPPAPVLEKTETPGTALFKQSITLAPFLAGTIVVPGPHYTFASPSGEKGAVRPPSVELTVASRLPADQKPEQLAPKADRPVRIPGYPPKVWIALGAAVLLVAGAIWWLLARRKRKGEAGAPAIPATPPGEEFLAALEVLKREVAGIDADPRAFYSALTHATKRYLERRLDQPVLEWTTFETVRRLRDQNLEFPREIGLSELLAVADRVKFGKGAATRHEAGQHLSRARLVHDHLEGVLAERERAATATAATKTAAVPPRKEERAS